MQFVTDPYTWEENIGCGVKIISTQTAKRKRGGAQKETLGLDPDISQNIIHE